MKELDKRTSASRRNGKLGGPKTEEGKLRSSANSYRHGLYARRPPVLSTEDRQQYDALRLGIFDCHQPAGEQELDIVTQLVDTAWRYHRYEGAQEWFLEGAIIDDLETIAAHRPDGIDPGARNALALNQCLLRPNSPLRELTRMLERLQRTQQRLLNILQQLQGPRFNTGSNQPAPNVEESGNEPTNPIESTPAPAETFASSPVLPFGFFPLEVATAHSAAELRKSMAKEAPTRAFAA